MKLSVRRRAATALWLGPAFGLLLLLGLVVGGLHHHANENASHACAICSLNHSPATTTATGVAAAPALRFERIALLASDELRSFRIAAPSSRAPPSA